MTDNAPADETPTDASRPDHLPSFPGQNSAAYAWNVAPDVETPLPAGRYEIVIVEGGTYENLASGRRYRVCSIDVEERTMRYVGPLGADEPEEREGRVTHLAVVTSVEGSPGGLFGREEL